MCNAISGLDGAGDQTWGLASVRQALQTEWQSPALDKYFWHCKQASVFWESCENACSDSKELRVAQGSILLTVSVMPRTVVPSDPWEVRLCKLFWVLGKITANYYTGTQENKNSKATLILLIWVLKMTRLMRLSNWYLSCNFWSGQTAGKNACLFTLCSFPWEKE